MQRAAMPFANSLHIIANIVLLKARAMAAARHEV